jgi:hypothetical protein
MDYVINAEPEECLNRAITYMMSEGYSIDNRSETSATLSRIPKWSFGPGMTCFLIAAALLSFGTLLALFGLLILLGIVKWKATLFAVPTPDGRTRLTTGGSHSEVEETLADMVREEFGDRVVA